MGKKKKGGDKKAAGEGEEYEFPMPDFDEKAFMRRELASAKSTLWTGILAIVAGFLAWLAQAFGGDWRLGAAVVLLAAAALKPYLRAVGFRDEVVETKGLVGNWFFLVFTALSVWVIALNL